MVAQDSLGRWLQIRTYSVKHFTVAACRNGIVLMENNSSHERRPTLFKSVFIKYVTAFMLINISCMIILTTIVSSIISTYNSNVKENTLKNAAQYISEYISDGIDSKDFDDINEYTTVYPETIHTYLDIMSVNVDRLTMIIADEDGKILLFGGSGSQSALEKKTSNSASIKIQDEFMKRLKTDKYVSEHSILDGLFEQEHVIYSLPIYANENKVVGAVIACSDNSGMNVLLDGTVKTIFMSTLWIMLAMLVAVYFISERLVSPIKAMSHAAKMFAKGKFDVRIPVYGDDEVSELATAFNNMASSLSTNEEMRRVFLANVSHDLRTPMTTISGFIDGIIDGASPPEKHEYYLGVIASEVRRLSRLVSSLLDISKIQAGERKFTKTTFDICELSRQVLISSEQRIESKHLDVDFRCDSDNMYVIGDTDAIHQVVYNLFDNGIKFSREGGKYVIEIREIAQKIEISVFNEGDGISENDLPYVFDRFYKSDKSRGLDKTGVGLGLYISRTIIEAHNESIWVDSKQGEWCKFTFTLPKGSAPKNTLLPDKLRGDIGGTHDL